jgi:hypothetical protein
MHEVGRVLGTRRTVAREREARAATRRDQRAASRITFQRETLLQLQGALQKLGRATGRTHHLDEMAYRKTGLWRKELLPEDLNEQYLAAQTQTSLLSSRVRDETVRHLVTTFRTCSTELAISTDGAQSFRSLRAMMAVSDELHSRIGELIRSIDDDDA